jgi:hypothetical protein
MQASNFTKDFRDVHGPSAYQGHDPALLTQAYAAATPFPHIKVDDFYPEARLDEVRREIHSATVDPEAPGYGWFGKRRASELSEFPPQTRSLVEELNSPAFLRWLETVTGIADLQPDPFLEGGGIHRIPPGGYLKIHTDFNWHRRLQLHRRINVLLYLNRDWDENWGGQIELWHEDEVAAPTGKPDASFAPIFNRMVIFSTTDSSYHGHPHPLACPEDRTRDSIALYYYTRDRPPAEVRFGKSDMTNYRAKAGEQLGLKHRLHQFVIRHPAWRFAIEFVRRKLKG